MPTINCIECGAGIYVSLSYWDYKGKLRCPHCKALLQVEFESGDIRSVDLAK